MNKENFILKLLKTFGKGGPPENIMKENYIKGDFLAEDVFWFASKNWFDLEISDWNDHMDAIYHFNPEAFRYYIPSILKLSYEDPNTDCIDADSLIFLMSQCYIKEEIGPYFLDRFLYFTNEQLLLVLEWLDSLQNHNNSMYADGLEYLQQSKAVIKMLIEIRTSLLQHKVLKEDL